MVRIFLSTILVCLAGFTAFAQIETDLFAPAEDSIAAYFKPRAVLSSPPYVKSANLLKGNTLEITFSRAFADYPYREEDIPTIKKYIQECVPKEYKKRKLVIRCESYTLQELASDYYSAKKYPDPIRQKGKTWIERTDSKTEAPSGLEGKHIAIWPGHGYYYESNERRWKWQRAPFFSTIEDLFPADYIFSFIAPMLENAGAYVLIPRERDRNKLEIIVDEGSPFHAERSTGKPWEDSALPGFADTADFYHSGENPFTAGTARTVSTSKARTATVSYLPFFPEQGKYAVYVSYQSLPESTIAEYRVRHSGGESTFNVNQAIGGGSWVYLGSFEFSKGESGQGVILTNAKKGVLSADAVKFGGGMGNILRDSVPSGMPRFAESSRYWMQWSGFPASVYTPNADTMDYPDDYLSKGLWVNYMKDTLGIPVDLALALHTDAGTTKKDSTIGTLAIYTRVSDNSQEYSDGRPRIVSRELADIVQTQIVDDIRSYYRADWSRRGLADRSYFEARMPDVPSVLVELLSHQNFSDMQCGLDPKFKFIASRAIYKGILKFSAYISGSDYVVQPLPVRAFSVRLEEVDGKTFAVLSWQPTIDSGEPTAMPDSYLIQTMVTDSYSDSLLRGFDNGTVVEGESFRIPLDAGKVYSFKVTALNKGGCSFPSEILSAGYMPDSEKALVINAFRTVCGPATHASSDTLFAGFDFRKNSGIPYLYDYSYTGEQYEYRRDCEWIHDDNPGFGASYMDYCGTKRAGNTFDYPLDYGVELMKQGLSFCSSSSDAVSEENFPVTDYLLCSIIAGNDATSLSFGKILDYLQAFCSAGGSLLLSGSHVGEALDTAAATGIFKFKISNDHASNSGNIKTIHIKNSIVPTGKHYTFHTGPNPYSYPSEAPDALIPEGPDAFAFMRYIGANTTAAVCYDGPDYRSAVFGFPLETLTSHRQFHELLGEVIGFLAGTKPD